MSFDVAEYLGKLFGGDPSTVAKTAGQESTLEATPLTDATLAASRFADWVRRPDATGRMGWERPGLSTFEELPELPPPCHKCGSLELWETLEGDWRCMRCDPPTTAIKVLEQAERIRRRCGIPSPPGVTEMLADLKRLTGAG